MDGSIKRIDGQLSIQPAAPRRQKSTQRRFQLDEDEAGELSEQDEESMEPQHELQPRRPPGHYPGDLSVGRADQDESGSRIDLTA